MTIEDTVLTFRGPYLQCKASRSGMPRVKYKEVKEEKKSSLFQLFLRRAKQLMLQAVLGSFASFV